MKEFLACTETVTLVSHSADGDSDTYMCIPITGVSWYEKLEVAVSGDGARPANFIKVRIPSAVAPKTLPKKLDFIVKGSISGVTRPADLKGKTYFQIATVSDNRRGRLPHIMVSGA